MERLTWPVQPRGCAVEPSGSERDTIKSEAVQKRQAKTEID